MMGMSKNTSCRIINAAMVAGFLLVFLSMGWSMIYYLVVAEPAREATLIERLDAINNAETVEDLKPLLRSMVRQQRTDRQ